MVPTLGPVSYTHLDVYKRPGFYVPSVLLIEEQHVVVQDEGCLIEAFLHVEKAEATDP